MGAACLAALALALTGCAASGGGGAQSTGAVENGGTLRIGVSTSIDTLNPFTSQEDYSSVVYQYVYPHLVVYNSSLKLVGSFAKSWSDSDGGKTWTFDTVPHAKWSDGQPLTAKDVAFTLNMMVKYQNGPTGQLSQLVTDLSSAVATNDDTVVLHYSAPVANVLAQMQGIHILPEHIWAKLATGNGKGITSFANDTTPMVSGGPFMMVKYQQNQVALFQRNPNWYGQKPHIDGFGIQMFGTADAMIAALKSGQVDMIGEATPPTAIATLKKAGMVVLTSPSVTMDELIINTTPTQAVAHRALANPKVREAMEYALDRKSMLQTALLGQGQVSGSIVAPVTGWMDPSIKPLPFDLAQANKILDEAGYRRGANGVRIADGQPMSYTLIFPTEINGPGDVMFKILQNDFAKIGIAVTERKVDPDTASTEIYGTNNTYNTFSLAMWNWVLPPDPSNILSVLTCGARGGNSDSGYCNPEYDQLFAKQGQLIDRAQRQSVVNQMQQIIFQDRPYIPLVYPYVIEAHSPKWAGFSMSPMVGSVNNLSIATLLNVHRVG